VNEVGLGIQTDGDADGYRRLAARAEEAGFDVLSVFNDLGFQPAFFALAHMAAVTERVRLGPACLNPFTQHPVEIASQLSTLDAASGGRAYLGLARGAWLSAAGVDPVRPLTAISDAAEIISRLLTGDPAGYDGEVFSLPPGLTLHGAPGRKVPLLIGTWGKRTAALAGRIATEVKVGGSANPSMVGEMRSAIGSGANAIGRDPADVGVVVGAVTVVDDDGEAARRRAATAAALYFPIVARLDPTLDVPLDLIAEVEAAASSGDVAGAGALIPEGILNRFAFAGTACQVANQAIGVFEAGAKRVEFGSPFGLTTNSGLDLLANQVLPNLR
jgi:5,10-methylenetetrahydromethanopterin reductase